MRIPRREHPQQVPLPVPGELGLFTVDGTWGTISPLQLAGGVRTVGELEVLEQIDAGLPLLDTRLEHFFLGGTIEGARNVPHGQIEEAIGSLSDDVPTVFFCNGPQCAATPAAVRALLAAGHPASLILFYRGSIHDWVTLGLPLTCTQLPPEDP